jgi:hypothetical protein
LKLLNDPDVARKLMHMLATCMGEEGTTIAISSPLPERDVCQVSKQKHTGREFKMMVELRSYEMDGVMLDLGSDVNIFPKKSWELMGKPNLVWSPIQLQVGKSIQNLSYRLTGAGQSEHRRGEDEGIF